MPFRVVSGVGRVIGVLDGVEIVEGRGSFGGKCMAFDCNQWGTLWHSCAKLRASMWYGVA